ncbi:MAG: MgtC/SapB family protein [Candidatus Omnitrophica bacterium]|nr:MgtC/SapB family protein [Candidatus Omnitrophota bacterium]
MIDINDIAIRLMLATVLSGIIGYEREIHGRAAGLRTTILVGVGSCLIMLTSINLHAIYQGIANVDPSRIPAQVISGIGFLGAGTILRFHASVRGLTTAAALWAVAGIGIAIGSGFYAATFLSTGIIFIVLVALSHFERKITRSTERVINVEAVGGIDLLSEITKTIDELDAEIKNIDIKHTANSESFNVSMHLQFFAVKINNQITTSLLRIKGVTSVKWV